MDKAKKLLLDNLTDQQKEDYKKDGKFTVISKGEEYDLYKDITVRKKDGSRFCAVLNAGEPIEDQLLARKLYLEKDPAKFFSVANKFESNRFPQSGQWTYTRDRDINNIFSRPIVEYVRDVFSHYGFVPSRLEAELITNYYLNDSITIRINYWDIYWNVTIDRMHLENMGGFENLIRPFLREAAEGMYRKVVEKYTARPREYFPR